MGIGRVRYRSDSCTDLWVSDIVGISTGKKFNPTVAERIVFIGERVGGS
jgi:hypothetical protein